MDNSFSILVFIGLLCLSAFFSASETALFSLSPIRMKKLEDEGDRKAAEILKILADKQTMLVTILLGNTLVNVIATAMATHFMIETARGWAAQTAIPGASSWSTIWTSPNMAVAESSFLMTILLLVFGEITPKTVALYNSVGFAKMAVKPLRMIIYLLSPITGLVTWVLHRVFPSFSDWNQKLGSATSLEEIDSYFSLGEEVGIIARDEKEMISSVFEFGDPLVREVMVPRPDIMAVPVTIVLDDLLKLFRDDGHSRFPVFEGTLDKIVGIVYVKDILVKLDEIKTEFKLAGMLRPAYFVPETKKLDDLLREFQKRKLHVALVVDEFGGISGLVTIEDLLEEIVGEIVDEYDSDELPPIVAQGDDTWSVDARYSLSDLEAELGIKLDYEDSETVGGLVLERLGRIPKRDERVEDPQASLQVTDIKGNRILRLKVVRKPRTAASVPGAGA